MTRRKFIERSSASAVVAAVPQSESKPAKTAQSKKAGKNIVRTDKAPKPVGPYNQAIVAGNTIYVAGQGAIDPRTGKFVTGAFEEHAAQTFENVSAILKAAGATLEDVVKVNVYLADLNDFSKMNEVYKKYFPSGAYPARTTVGAQLLPGLVIEVDCIAVKS